jgi:CBS-domain-containing membrane protein
MATTAPTAADIMDRSELTLAVGDNIDVAMNRMLKASLTGAPVVDSDGVLCGMLTEKDCLGALVSEAIDGSPGGRVCDYMTTPAESITPKTILLDIVQLFLNRPYRKVPVVDPMDHVIGQVSRRDILRALAAAGDNSYLYGTEDRSFTESSGVNSAMRRALGKS